MIIKINGKSINTSCDPKYNEIDNDVFKSMMELWEETSGIKIDETMDVDFEIEVTTTVKHFEEKLF
jgi:hypothetical protein